LAERIEAVQAEIIPSPFHVRGREGDPERLAQDAEVLEKDLFLELLRAGGDQHALAAEDRRHQVRQRLAGSGSRLDEHDPTVAQRLGHDIGHLTLGGPAFERGQRPGERP
jgi:hypothetical protein